MAGNKLKGGVRINRYEQEVNRADMDTAAELARHLNVPLSFLFSADDQEADLLLAFARLPKPLRAAALAAIHKLVEECQDAAPRSPDGTVDGEHAPP